MTTSSIDSATCAARSTCRARRRFGPPLLGRLDRRREIDARRLHGGQQAAGDHRQRSDADRERRHPPVHLHVVGQLRWRKIGPELPEQASGPATRRAGQRRRQPARPSTLSAMSRRTSRATLGAERQADRHLSRAVHATREHHAADVRARDEQHEAGQRREERDESRRSAIDHRPAAPPPVPRARPCRRLSSGYSRARSLAMRDISAPACAALTPSFSRPIPMSHC